MEGTSLRQSVRSMMVGNKKVEVVHVFTRHNEEIHAFSFSIKETPLSIIESVKQRLCIAEKLTMVVPNVHYKIIDSMEGSPIGETIFYKNSVELGIIPVFELIPREKAESYQNIGLMAKGIEMVKENYKIVSDNYLEILKSDTDDLFLYRRDLAKVRILSRMHNFNKELLEMNEFCYTYSEPAVAIRNIEHTISIYGENYTTVCEVGLKNPNINVKTLIKFAYDKMKEGGNNAVTSDNVEDYVLKVVGYNEFICPYKPNGKDYLLGDFDYIRRCWISDCEVKLELTKKDVLLKYYSEKENDMMSSLDKYFAGDFWAAFELINVQSQKELKENLSGTVHTIENLYCKIKEKKENSLKDLLKGSKEKEVEEKILVNFNCYLKVDMYYGEISISQSQYSPIYEVKNGLVSMNWTFKFDHQISKTPSETKIIYSLYYTQKALSDLATNEVQEQDNDVCIFTVNTKIVNNKDYLLQGLQQHIMWEGEMNPIAMCCNATNSKVKLMMEYPIHNEKEIMMDAFKTDRIEYDPHLFETQKNIFLSRSQNMNFTNFLNSDAMSVFGSKQKQLVWDNRYLLYQQKPDALARLVLTVDFTNEKDVYELHNMVNQWPLLSPQTALELLDFRFPDSEIRKFAIKCLDSISDDQLVMFLPQLVQTLKFELHNYSSLSIFLLKRALRNKRRIGHNLFWFLKAEMHDNRVAGRYGVLLEAFLLGCGKYKEDLYNEVKFQEDLVKIANEVKEIPVRDDQKAHLKSSLAKLQYPPDMSLPIDSRFRISHPVPGTGNVFSSKKRPLMLVLQNADPIGEPIMVIQKVGDDLRQDILTLQMLRLMNTIWKKELMDFRMQPYLCIATGNEIGMLELVKNSETYGAIIATDKSKFSVIKDNVLANWLKEHCAKPESKVTYEEAVENFTLSCAAYCVATYILGIGDRHSDNVMISRDGRFFHIDFGHFLGNFKSKFGIKRERTPFKFTKHFAAVMGGKGSKQFEKFEQACMEAFACIRNHGNLFIYLFRLMLATGIPELQKASDIEYMREMFMFDKTESEAKEQFRLIIYKCLDAWSQTVNDAIHDFVHYK